MYKLNMGFVRVNDQLRWCFRPFLLHLHQNISTTVLIFRPRKTAHGLTKDLEKNSEPTTPPCLTPEAVSMKNEGNRFQSVLSS